MIARLLSRTPLAWAGLIAGPVAWAADQQINYWLVDAYCTTGLQLDVAFSVVAALVALGCGWLSWTVRRRSAPGGLDTDSRFRERAHFVAGLSGIAAGLFTLAIIGQGIAGLIFTGCER